jgi:DNA modification methylase
MPGKILYGNSLEILPKIKANRVQCVITSPPYYGLRDYKINDQIGLERTPEEYVLNIVGIFKEVRRILRDSGTVWLNLGDTYAGSNCGTNDYQIEMRKTKHTSDIMYSKQPPQKILTREGQSYKPKDLIGIPWKVAFALQADGWYLRQDIIWNKPNCMPESVKDRCTKSHEYVFLLSKNKKYYFDYKAIQEVATGYDSRKDTTLKGSTKYANTTFSKQHMQTIYYHECQRWQWKDGDPIRNKRSVWQINTVPFKGAHFATFPEKLVEPCILAGSSKGDIVLDPFFGTGTVAIVAERLDRKWVGIELNPEYITIAKNRINTVKERLT